MAFRLAIVPAWVAAGLLLPGCVTPSLQSSVAEISISRGLWYASYCTSTCFGPTKITLSSDGAVTQEFFGQQDRSRISVAEAAEFRKTLAPYRWSAPVSCEQVIGGKYPAPFSYPRRLGELKVTWTGRDGTSQLVACDTPENAALSNAIKRALKLLHLGY